MFSLEKEFRTVRLTPRGKVIVWRFSAQGIVKVRADIMREATLSAEGQINAI